MGKTQGGTPGGKPQGAPQVRSSRVLVDEVFAVTDRIIQESARAGIAIRDVGVSYFLIGFGVVLVCVVLSLSLFSEQVPSLTTGRFAILMGVAAAFVGFGCAIRAYVYGLRQKAAREIREARTKALERHFDLMRQDEETEPDVE